MGVMHMVEVRDAILTSGGLCRGEKGIGGRRVQSGTVVDAGHEHLVLSKGQQPLQHHTSLRLHHLCHHTVPETHGIDQC